MCDSGLPLSAFASYQTCSSANVAGIRNPYRAFGGNAAAGKRQTQRDKKPSDSSEGRLLRHLGSAPQGSLHQDATSSGRRREHLGVDDWLIPSR
jgi:hypothetical protein